jgi:hypothetical protein
MAKGVDLRFCGSRVSAAELELIEGVITDCRWLSRTELAHSVCELLDWRRANGSLKAHECRLFLEYLENKGFLCLPASKGNGCRPRRKPSVSRGEPETAGEPLVGTLGELGTALLELVETQKDRLQWREWVGRYHYLGCKVPFGAHLRYFVRIDGPKVQRVACLQISSPAWRIAVRDQWIGWDDRQRLKGLQRIVQNSRFLILPWVRVSNLASAVLAQMARQIANDWQIRYGARPLLAETLVDPARFSGTCYRAANWIHLGQTSGRGRMDRGHNRHGAAPKEVFVYPLCRKAREKLREA